MALASSLMVDGLAWLPAVVVDTFVGMCPRHLSAAIRFFILLSLAAKFSGLEKHSAAGWGP